MCQPFLKMHPQVLWAAHGFIGLLGSRNGASPGLLLGSEDPALHWLSGRALGQWLPRRRWHHSSAYTAVILTNLAWWLTSKQGPGRVHQLAASSSFNSPSALLQGVRHGFGVDTCLIQPPPHSQHTISTIRIVISQHRRSMACTASMAKQANGSHTDLIQITQRSDYEVQHTSNMPGMRQSHTLLTNSLVYCFAAQVLCSGSKDLGNAGNARLPPVILHRPFEALQCRDANPSR